MNATVDWLLSLLPILAVVALMLFFRWRGAAAGAAGWALAALVAALRFGAGWEVLAYAQLKGFLISLFVVYIIWGALLFYRTTDEAGVVGAVGRGVAGLTSDRGQQALLLGWVFSSFLQGVGGMGVPVAVVAPLLVELGFPALTAVVISSVGHAWAVAFGSVGTPFYALMAATGSGGDELAFWAAVLTGLACFACGAGSLWAAGRWRALRSGLAPLGVIGATMVGVQLLVVTNGLWSVGAMLAGLSGLAVGMVWARRHNRRNGQADHAPTGQPKMATRWALVPYALLVVIVLLAQLEPLRDMLDQVVLRVEFPELTTARGFSTAAGEGRSLSVLSHTGALLTYVSLLTYGLMRWRGAYRPGAARRIVSGVFGRIGGSALGIVAIVGMAATMEHAGMMQVLADGIVRGAGQAFPFVAPFIGALGAFVTGSNTSANLLFAPLQQEVAVLIGVSPLLILSAQTAGAAVGSAFAPNKIIVGCSTVEAEEAAALRKVMRYILIVVAGLAVATGVLAHSPLP
ncbi:MAG: L-lactate permease [Anaerolineales bacterium]|nr:MAG: L-lactate permease [Anaerolineales bacterium]